ncbi:MAG TPA: HAD hydrolase family protein [Bacteroidales bacterium]|nr:HAD hydrolase family protein [Bacteroidales bacterium]
MSKNIRYLRNKQQVNIIDMADQCEIPLEIIGNIEEKLDEAGIEYLVKIAKFLNTDIEKLVTLDMEEKFMLLNNFKLGLLVMDVDGVLTDGGMYYTQSGDEFKKFNTKDGLAIKNFVSSGKKAAFISSGINDNIIKKRADLLGVQYVYVGTWDKVSIIQKWCEELNISFDNVAYIGDDINDINVFEKVGISFCPADAVHEIKKRATIILSREGGDGCVREMLDEYLNKI